MLAPIWLCLETVPPVLHSLWLSMSRVPAQGNHVMDVIWHGTHVLFRHIYAICVDVHIWPLSNKTIVRMHVVIKYNATGLIDDTRLSRMRKLCPSKKSKPVCQSVSFWSRLSEFPITRYNFSNLSNDRRHFYWNKNMTFQMRNCSYYSGC